MCQFHNAFFIVLIFVRKLDGDFSGRAADRARESLLLFLSHLSFDLVDNFSLELYRLIRVELPGGLRPAYV